MQVHCAKRCRTWRENLAIALIALFLLLAALFRSVKDSMYVILTIPLASFGGVLALVLLRLFTPQTLDLLTMVGFVVLMGLVVNNAILLVDQARSEMRGGATVRAAVESALATRTRPIMLTTLTTLFGMLPLVLVPGPGSVLYRGLGTVLVGGMAVNSVFTLVLLPTLLRLIEKPDAASVGGTRQTTRGSRMKLARMCLPWSFRCRSHRRSSPPTRLPVPVVVTTVRSENFGASLTATGTVVSRNDARISGEVGGTLAWIAEPGAAVKRGDTIARIDARTARAHAARQRCRAQAARGAALPAGHAAHAAQTLGNVVSQSQLDEALSRERMAEQDVEQARVARDRARLDLNRAAVRAPFDGVVAERLQQAGEFVASGAPLLRLVNDRELEVVARAPLTTADTVTAGAEASSSTATARRPARCAPSSPWATSARAWSSCASRSTDHWRVGTPVRVEIAPRTLRKVVTVPRDAVILRQGASYVMRVRPDNTAERVAVNIGPGRANHVQIDGTLRAGDRVIIRGGERLEPGQTVKVQLLCRRHGRKEAAADDEPHRGSRADRRRAVSRDRPCDVDQRFSPVRVEIVEISPSAHAARRRVPLPGVPRFAGR